ncbi:DUF4446 family protein [Candidatus Microgenomates bacterium]|nr:DUF4446 family protein [Candidatus Microgenomates bacterium]
MQNIILFSIVIIIVWLIIISLFLFKNISHYNKIIFKAKEGDLKKLLEELIKSDDQSKKDIKRIYALIASIQKDGQTHLQKLGLVRYNPFNDTGGDHSFSLSALDGNGNGFVLTGLHTRDKTRFYIKAIKEAKASRELSNEEARAIELAVKS